MLRDRFAVADADRVLPVHDVAIVDEADSALIDEALTPLVLAAAPESAVSELAFVAELIAPLTPGTDFTVAADRSTVTLTDDGIDRLEARLGGRNLYAGEGLPLLTQINLALHAREILHRDVDYIVRDGVVQLLNVGRGRIAHGQRWPDGLHAAIEAKEGLAPSTGGRVLDSLEDDLVQQHAPGHLLTAFHRQREALPAAERARIVAVSQRISEGVRRDRHRATWETQRAIAAQRATVLRYRERVRTDATGLDAMRDRVPAPLWGRATGKPAPGAEARDDGECGEHPRDVPAALISTVREVTLHFLDESWSAHLAVLQEIRDGIHLRALASQRPADEFHRIALREFSGFFSTVHEGVAEFIQRLTPADLGRSAAKLGLHRPSTTWTYMVTDDPLGSASDRLARRLGTAWRSKVLGIE